VDFDSHVSNTSSGSLAVVATQVLLIELSFESEPSSEESIKFDTEEFIFASLL